MRKKIVISFALIIGLNLSTNAQDKGDVELGGQIGLNVSNVTNGQDNATSKVSFNVGAFADFYINDRWSIKPKVIYDRKGWADGYIGSISNKTNYKVNYITVPVTANYHFGGTRRWYFNFGGYVGVLASAEDSEYGVDVKEFFKSTDFGLALGIGHKFPIADNVNLFIEYEAQTGLIDIAEENSGDAIRNGRSALNAGLVFLLN